MAPILAPPPIQQIISGGQQRFLLPNAEPLISSAMIGKRNLQPRSWVTGMTSCTYRTRYPIAVSATNIQMNFPDWSTITAGTGDVASGNTITIAEAYVEYNGLLYPITFGGNASFAITSGATLTTDVVAGLSVAAGTTMYVRIYITVASGGRWPGMWCVVDTTEEISRPGTNLANGLGSLAGTGQSTANLFGPMQLFGDIRSPQNSITIFGDSIVSGNNDAQGDPSQLGYWQRALWNGNRAFSLVSLGGETASQFLSQGILRETIIGEHAHHVVCEYLINDMQSDGASLATCQARMLLMAAIPDEQTVRKRWQQTITPSSTSTDGWVTVGNQTAGFINTVRTQFNDWLRDGAPIVNNVAVATGTVAAIRMGQAGHPYQGYVEVADYAESARNSGLWKAGYTNDGLHPNATGNAAIAAAMDMSVFSDVGYGSTTVTSPVASSGSSSGATTLARSSTSPVINASAFQGSSNTQAWSSQSFSPPAGSTLIVIGTAGQPFNNTWNTPTITDSLGSHLTWTLVDQQHDISITQNTGSVALWWANCPSAQTNMTVTVTQSCTAGQNISFSAVSVGVWTGADTTSPIGNTVKGFSQSASLGVAITPAGSGSALMMGVSNVNGSGTAISAGTGEYAGDIANSSTVGAQGIYTSGQVWYGDNLGPTIPATAQTLDVSATSPIWNYIAYEVKAASTPVSAEIGRSAAAATSQSTVKKVAVQGGSCSAVPLVHGNHVSKRIFDAENLTDGVTLSTGNVPATGVTGTRTASAASAMQLTLGYDVSPTSTGQAYFRVGVGYDKLQSIRLLLNPNTTAGTRSWLAGRSSAGNVFRSFISAAGVVTLLDNAGANTITGPTLSLNTNYEVQITTDVGSSSTTGSISISFYNLSTGAQVGSTMTSSAYNLGSVPWTELQCGASDTASGAARWFYDNVRIASGTTDAWPATGSGATAENGLGVGIAATSGTARKVAVQGGSCSTPAVSSGTGRKVTAVAGVAAQPAAAVGVAKKVTAQAGLSSAPAVTVGTAKKVFAQRGVDSGVAVTTGTARKAAVQAGPAAGVAATSGTAKKVAVQKGPAAGVASTLAVEAKVAKASGASSAVGASVGAEVKKVAQAGLAAGVAVSRASQSSATTIAELGVTAGIPVTAATEKKVAVQGGRCTAVGATTGTARKVGPGRGTCSGVAVTTRSGIVTRAQSGSCGSVAVATGLQRKVSTQTATCAGVTVTTGLHRRLSPSRGTAGAVGSCAAVQGKRVASRGTVAAAGVLTALLEPPVTYGTASAGTYRRPPQASAGTAPAGPRAGRGTYGSG